MQITGLSVTLFQNSKAWWHRKHD